ncbi:hypothetical protein K438DRAFT_2019374 [Mycena galopus ATCC 62051]|nr:hypothetical protein K438DRAFT_2019374 [Mycena galopus ATCC 62051]
MAAVRRKATRADPQPQPLSAPRRSSCGADARPRRLSSLGLGADRSSGASPSSNGGVTDSLYAPYLPPLQYDAYFSAGPFPFICASPPSSSSSTTPHPPSSASACSSDSSYLPPSPTASDFSARSSLCTYRGPLAFSSETVCAGRPYSDASGFLPCDSAYLSSEAAYEHDLFAKGAVRVVHRSCEALPAHGTTARSLRRTGKGRRVLRPLEAEPERVLGSGFTGHGHGREDGHAKEDEVVHDSGVYLPASITDDGLHFTLDLDADADEAEAEPFTPPRTSTPPPPPPYTSRPPPSPSPSSPPTSTSASYTLASASSLARAPTARTYPLPSVQTRPKSRRRLPRPSSPFPLPLGRSVSASAYAH